MKIINECLSGIQNVFDAEHEKRKLRELHAHNYAHSIYGTASQSANSHFCEASVMAAKRAEAVAELAAKEAQCKLMEEERKQKEKIRMMESELERLQAERDRELAGVRLESYDREIKQETDNQPLQQMNSLPTQQQDSKYNRQNPAIPSVYHQNPSIVPPNSPTDISSLAQAIQDSITINRLPMTMPTAFGGDPIHYIEWRASFMSLIDRKGISSADKKIIERNMSVALLTNVLKVPFIETMTKHTEMHGISSTNATGSHLSFKGTNCQNGRKCKPKTLKG